MWEGVKEDKIIELMKIKSIYCLGLGVVLCLTACSEDSFRVDGDVEGGDGQSVVLEKPDFHGVWTVVDSTRLSSSGGFSFKAPRGAGPEVYRLRLDDRYVYFPIDSTESVKVSTTLANFGHLYTLSGSDRAERLARFESDFARFASRESNPDSAAVFKRRIYSEYVQPDPASVVSYFILTKTMADGTPLYDVDGEDHKYLAAVATAYRQFRPEDPHTAMLEGFALNAMRNHRQKNGVQTVVNAEEISFLPLTLSDEKGEERRLADNVGKGEKTLLVFASLTDADAPERNRRLLELSKRGWRIFQVSYDADQYGWRDAAVNLPWITVNDASGNPASVTDYNITVLPTYYLFDASGNLHDRRFDLKGL